MHSFGQGWTGRELSSLCFPFSFSVCLSIFKAPRFFICVLTIEEHVTKGSYKFVLCRGSKIVSSTYEHHDDGCYRQGVI